MLTFTNGKLNPSEASGPPNPDGLGSLAILPQFFGDATQPDAIAAVRAWTADLFPGIAEQNYQVASGQLDRLDFPVTIAFGANDPYLNTGVAQHLHSLFRKSVLRGIPDAAHWPQWDQPAADRRRDHRELRSAPRRGGVDGELPGPDRPAAGLAADLGDEHLSADVMDEVDGGHGVVPVHVVTHRLEHQDDLAEVTAFGGELVPGQPALLG